MLIAFSICQTLSGERRLCSVHWTEYLERVFVFWSGFHSALREEFRFGSKLTHILLSIWFYLSYQSNLSNNILSIRYESEELYCFVPLSVSNLFPTFRPGTYKICQPQKLVEITSLKNVIISTQNINLENN